MKRFLAEKIRAVAFALGTLADTLDIHPRKSACPVRRCNDAEVIETVPVTVEDADSKERVLTRVRNQIDMNIDDASRIEWATLFLDWLYDNVPNRGQLTGAELKALAGDFNSWARVQGPPIGPYMFKWLRKVGITATNPIRDQANYCPGKRIRQRVYGLPRLSSTGFEAARSGGMCRLDD